MRALRVLMVTTEWPRERWGGTATFIQRQADFLRAAGVDVDVLQFVGARNPANYARAWWAVRHRLARHRYDLIHAQFGQSALVALPKPLPLVVTFRGDDLQGILADGDHGRVTLLGRVLPRLSRFVARRADQVIVVSPHMRDFLGEGIAAHVLPSGLDFDALRLEPQGDARRALGLPADRRLVLFIGNPRLARKRHDLALAAVTRIDPALSAELVVAWGMPHATVVRHLNACDALVFTSVQEGSPNAVKEALACNLPIVSVPVGDVPERLAGVEGCEVCADYDPATIAAALERVLRRGGRVRGRVAVAELDERRITERLLTIYRAALNGRSHL